MIQRKKPLARSTKALKRSPLPKATNRPKARKADPAKRRFAKLRDPEYVAWIRTRPCYIAPNHQCEGAIEATHIKSRGAGGADVENLLPLCAKAHRDQHQRGIVSWAAQYDMVPGVLIGSACYYTFMYDRERGP